VQRFGETASGVAEQAFQVVVIIVIFVVAVMETFLAILTVASVIPSVSCCAGKFFPTIRS